MSYTTPDKVAALVGFSPQAEGQFTSTDGDVLIALAEDEIDAYASMAGLSVPATTPAVIVLCATLLSAARWEDRIYTQVDPNRSARALAWRREALGGAADSPPGELGGLLGAWVSSSQTDGGVRWQTDLDTDGEDYDQPWFTRQYSGG